jgi:ParB-like chromosome segregation protein Spo0J
LDYDRFEYIEVKKPEKIKHIIHKAIKWKQMLDDGSVNSMSEIAKKEGFTRARITQIMNLLKLPTEMQVFLLELDDAKQIRKNSERKLRGYHE